MVQPKSLEVTGEVCNNNAIETAFETGFWWKKLWTVKQTLLNINLTTDGLAAFTPAYHD